MPIGLITHMDTTRPEDVVDLVTNIDYESTPFFSTIDEASASNTLHEWLTDSYDAAADNATIESSDATTVDLTQPTRNTNVVQLFRKVVTVSDTQRAIPHYGENDPYAYQLNKKMKELARDVEKALIQGTNASGSSGVARRLDGAIALITTNKTAQTSGTSFEEVLFNDMVAGIYDNGTDQNVDKVFTGSYLKRAISGFTGGATVNVDADVRKIWNTVSIYESDFGIHMIHLSREVPSGGVLMVDTSKWRKAFLVNRRFQHVPLAKTGSSTKGMVEGELTLEALNEGSSAYRSGYFTG